MKTACEGDVQRPELAASMFAPESVKRGPVRRSKMGKRRAWVLVGVHVVVFAHLLHWQLSGRTVSPLEPSEAMYTLARGVVNAGAILLGASLLATMLLGRWFCGWACHLVALQDGSAWLLKKVGIRPRPLRSRWLMIVPLLAGLHMFFFPVALRLARSIPAPELTDGMTKEGFWETFPGFWVGALTFLICGFAVVYLLGAKGFCTYACPYGGLFGVMDRLAPGRIRVTDACKGCGHCSAVCTSNVLVHQEVHEHGMVVDPGCMKCLDCVSVCPENALYYGFGRPSLLAPRRIRHKKKRARQFSLGEEATMLGIFALSLFVFRGLPLDLAPWAGHLYGELPLLFALGLAAITAFVSLFFWRSLRHADLGFQSWLLKRGGRLTRAGRVFVALASPYLVFVLHSAFIQANVWTASLAEEETAPIAAAAWRMDRAALRAAPPSIRDAVDRGETCLARAEAFGLVADVRIPRQRAWFALCRGDAEAAAEHLREAIRLKPDWTNSYFDLGRVEATRGRHAEAVDLLEEARRNAPEHSPFQRPLAMLVGQLAQLRLSEQAAGLLGVAVERHPDDPELRGWLASALQDLQRFDDGLEVTRRAIARFPDDPSLRVSEINLLAASGREKQAQEAIAAFARRFPELATRLQRQGH